MEERELAENIMKTVGSSLIREGDVTVSGLTIAERYQEMLTKAGYNPSLIINGTQAIRHYIICAAYVDGKFECHISDYVL